MREFFQTDKAYYAFQTLSTGAIMFILIHVMGIMDIPLRLFIQPFIFPLFLILVIFSLRLVLKRLG